MADAVPRSTYDAAPGAPIRARPAVRTRLVASIVWLVVGVLLFLLFALSLAYLYRSYQHPSPSSWPPWQVLTNVPPADNGPRLAVLVIGIVLIVGALAVPLNGVRAVMCSLRARRLTAEGNLVDARIAGEDARDRQWYVIGFGLAVFVLAASAWFLAANDGAVRGVFFQPHLMRISLGPELGFFWINVKIFMAAEAIVLVWALLVALVRMIPGRAGAPIRFIAVAYVDVFRGLPAIFVITVVVFGFQLARVPGIKSMSPDNSLFWLAVLSLVLVYGAYVAEVYRSGLESIHWSQMAAARSLGLSHVQTLRFVIVPQAIRRIIPPLLNDFIGLQKDTALVTVVGLVEVFGEGKLLENKYFNLTPVVMVGVFFLAITIPLARFTDYLVKRDAEKMRASGG